MKHSFLEKVPPMFFPMGRLIACLVMIGLTHFSRAAQPVQCPTVNAFVTGANAPDFADVCEGAAQAVAFLTRYGLTQSEPLQLEVNQKLPDEAGPTAVGCYIEKRRRSYLVPYRSFQAKRTWFGVRINRALYRAAASHEASHALAACNFRIPHPTIRAKEYLAYVTMWSSMPPDLRQKALQTMAPEGFNTLERFTPMLYLFDPMRIGAEAYLHFSTSADPAGLIEDILSGRALTD